MAQNDRVVIQGIRQDGSRLRPGDWIERLSSTMASFREDHRLRYSDSVKPCVVDGQKCLVVGRCLAERDPSAYQFIMAFAESNQLRVQMDPVQGKSALTCQDSAA